MQVISGMPKNKFPSLAGKSATLKSQKSHIHWSQVPDKKNKLPELRIHDLRHAYDTHHLAAGDSPSILSLRSDTPASLSWSALMRTLSQLGGRLCSGEADG